MKKLFSYIAILSILFLFSSCEIQEITAGDIQKVNITAMTKEYIDVDIAMPIKNPNNFSFKLTKADIDLSLNGVSLGKINKLKKVKIKANSNDVHTFSIRVNTESLKKGGLAFLGSLLSNKAGLEMKGYIKARAFLISKKIDMDYNKKVKIFKELF